MKIKELYTYPIKSARGVNNESVKVLPTGFQNDRCIAVVDRQGKIVTGREQPMLIHLVTSIYDGRLHIGNGTGMSFELSSKTNPIDVKLFRKNVAGTILSDKATSWISSYLDGDYRLIYIDDNFNSVKAKRGGLEGEYKGYADSAPIHLINLSTLNYLNTKLKSKVRIRNFRPNIVIDGLEAFEEDKFSALEINGCRFRVQERTSRCIFTTINPETAVKDLSLQPLAALANIRLKMGEKPTFGIGLVPLTEGIISIADEITNIENIK